MHSGQYKHSGQIEPLNVGQFSVDTGVQLFRPLTLGLCCDLFWTTNFAVTHVSAIFQEQQFELFLKVALQEKTTLVSYVRAAINQLALLCLRHIGCPSKRSNFLPKSAHASIFGEHFLDLLDRLNEGQWLRHVEQPLQTIQRKDGVRQSTVCSPSEVSVLFLFCSALYWSIHLHWAFLPI